jgi:hypothetical protein
MTTTTGQWVFEQAMSLLDSLDESTGQADTTDNEEYKNRALAILNLLQAECFPVSDTAQTTTAGKRFAPPILVSLDSVLYLDDELCHAILPYGLAAHLVLDENPQVASYCNQRYQELLARFRRLGTPAVSEPIEDLYGGINMGQFGRW